MLYIKILYARLQTYLLGRKIKKLNKWLYNMKGYHLHDSLQDN